MDVTWTTKAYGWEGVLIRNAKVIRDPSQPRHLRHAADRSTKKIESQLKDKKLMSLRTQLMGATKAGNEQAMSKITKQMRDHNGEDLETGLYD